MLPRVHGERTDMDLANDGGQIAVILKNSRSSLDMIERHEVVSEVIETVLAIFMSMQACIYDRSTSTAGGSARECIFEDGAFVGERIDMRGLDGFVAIAG